MDCAPAGRVIPESDILAVLHLWFVPIPSMPRLLAFALAAVPAAVVPCQVPVLASEARFVHPWPEIVTAGVLDPISARLVRFDPTSGIDAALLRTNNVGQAEVSRSVVVLRDVGRAHACVSLGSAMDFAVLPCTAGQQGVVTLGSDGALRLFRWATGQPLPTSQTIGMWPGFRRLAAVKNGATTELIGFDAMSIRIKRATWTGSQLGAASIVFVPPNLTYVESMDWNHDGVPELVLGTPAATYVQAWNMTPVTSIAWNPSPTQPVAITTCVSHSASLGDQLIFIAWDGAQAAMTWTNSATTGTLVLGPYQVGAVATYDRDGDGDEDVLIGDAEHAVVHVLLREPSGYSHHVLPLLVAAAAPDAGVGAIAGGDLDGDGDGDVLAWSRGALNVHTVLDVAAPAQRPMSLRADVLGLGAAAAVDLPVTVGLPGNLAAVQPAAIAFVVHFDGWLVDPSTGFVLPHRAVAQDVALAPSQQQLSATLSFALPASSAGLFHLELSAGVVAILAGGERRALPTVLLHATNDSYRVVEIWNQVDAELGGIGKIGGGDGGGDGNILGTKTGKFEIGVPPQ